MKSPDLNDLASFVAIVQAGSFSLAARQLGIPANTLSRRLKHLEENLEVKLLQRSTRNLKITSQGQKLFERCEVATTTLARAIRELADEKHSPNGMVRVAAPVDFFEIFEAAWAAEFLAKYPMLRLEFVLTDFNSNLIAERIDVAFRGGDLEDSALVARRIAASHHVLVAAPSYISTHGQPTCAAELANHDCIILPDPANSNRWRLTGPDGTLEVKVKGRLAVDNTQAIRRAAIAGLGVALMPAALVTEDLRNRLLVRVLPSVIQKKRGVYAVFADGGYIPLATSLFVDFVGEKLRAALPSVPATGSLFPIESA